MRRRPITNVPASVHARLLNVARNQGTQLNFLLQSYAAERFLYRMGRSPASDRFTLKGATLFLVWGADTFRGTRDVDLLRSGYPDHEVLRRDLETIGDVPCPEDGVVFERGEAGTRLRPLPLERTQGAVRVRMNATLGTIRLPLQVDVGFGDLPIPERERCTCPVLLDQPEPTVWTYRRETHIAEKFHAMVRLGRGNSRMKDLWDIAALAGRFSFDGRAPGRNLAYVRDPRHEPGRGGSRSPRAVLLLRRGARETVGRVPHERAPLRRRSGGATGCGRPHTELPGTGPRQHRAGRAVSASLVAGRPLASADRGGRKHRHE